MHQMSLEFAVARMESAGLSRGTSSTYYISCGRLLADTAAGGVSALAARLTMKVGLFRSAAGQLSCLFCLHHHLFPLMTRNRQCVFSRLGSYPLVYWSSVGYTKPSGRLKGHCLSTSG